MNINNKKIFALFASVCMLLTILPAAALHEGNLNNVTVNSAAQVFARNASGASGGSAVTLMADPQIMNRDRIQYSKQLQHESLKARKDLNRAKAMFNNGSATEEDIFNVSRDYLNTTIDYMITSLNETKTVLKENNGDEDQIELLESYIKELEEAKESLEDAEDRKDLADVAKSVRDIWKDAHKDINLPRAVHIVRGLEAYLVKAERTSERLDFEITRLNESGVDTSGAEELLGEYNSLVAEASEYLDLAKDNYQANTTEAAAYVQLAINNIKEANTILRDLLGEIKDQRPGYAKFAGPGVVNAEGDGTAVLSGDLDIELSATNATLVVKDLAGDAVVDVEGEYDLFNGGESRGEGVPSQVYHNFTGNASISGSRLTVMVHGFDISFEGEGMGSVMLSGEGSCEINDENISLQSFEWANVVDDEGDDEDHENDEGDESNENETEDME